MMLTRSAAFVVAPQSQVSRRATAPSHVAPRLTRPTQALPVDVVYSLAAEAAPGSVDAPVWVIAVGAVVVTAASLLISLGLKPGTDAAAEMQKRDSKKFNRRD